MKRVLIAEDNVNLRSIFEIAFEAWFDVHLAEDGQAAIDHLLQDVPDVLVLDVNMPRVTGLEVLAFVRQELHQHDVKVILVTGNIVAMTDNHAQAADLVLVKPVSVEELVTLTNRLAGDMAAALD